MKKKNNKQKKKKTKENYTPTKNPRCWEMFLILAMLYFIWNEGRRIVTFNRYSIVSFQKIERKTYALLVTRSYLVCWLFSSTLSSLNSSLLCSFCDILHEFSDTFLDGIFISLSSVFWQISDNLIGKVTDKSTKLYLIHLLWSHDK